MVMLWSQFSPHFLGLRSFIRQVVWYLCTENKGRFFLIFFFYSAWNSLTVINVLWANLYMPCMAFDHLYLGCFRMRYIHETGLEVWNLYVRFLQLPFPLMLYMRIPKAKISQLGMVLSFIFIFLGIISGIPSPHSVLEG